MKNYWCENDELLMNNINSSINRFHQRLSLSSLTLSSFSIPKILHFIWLGPNELLPKYIKCIETWQIIHSNWTLKLWTDENIKDLNFDNRDIFDKADNYGMKSDILRYEILYREGGIYIDIDYECLQSIENIINNCTFFAGLSSTLTLEISNGIIGSIPGHPLLQMLLSSIKTLQIENITTNQLLKSQVSSFLSNDEGLIFSSLLKSTIDNEKHMKTIRNTGPGLLTRTLYNIFSDQMLSNEIVIFTKNIFSPIPNSLNVDLDNIDEKIALKSKYIDIDTIAIHWHQRSWQC